MPKKAPAAGLSWSAAWARQFLVVEQGISVHALPSASLLCFVLSGSSFTAQRLLSTEPKLYYIRKTEAYTFVVVSTHE